MAAQRYPEAITEFKKILDHPGIVFTDPVRVVARLQIGRAFAAAGERIKAKAAYEEFLMLWKDADRDIPLQKLAKEEYGRL
jgi:hypothetical protein